MWSLSPFLHVYRGAILSPDDRQLSCMATGPSTATNRWPLQWTAVRQERESERERGERERDGATIELLLMLDLRISLIGLQR